MIHFIEKKKVRECMDANKKNTKQKNRNKHRETGSRKGTQQADRRAQTRAHADKREQTQNQGRTRPLPQHPTNFSTESEAILLAICPSFCNFEVCDLNCLAPKDRPNLNYLKKTAPQTAWANENLSCGFPSIPGIAPGVPPRIMVFALPQVVRGHTENGISHSENYPQGPKD